MDFLFRLGRGRVALVGALLALAALLTPTPTRATTAALGAPSTTWRTFANGDDIYDLALEGQNTVWAGTRGGGVIRWDISSLAGPSARQYLFPQDGLAGNIVRAVAVDMRGNKWFGTDRGLSRLTPDGAWSTYTVENTSGALPGNTVTALAVQGDTLWVGAQQVWSAADKKWIQGGLARAEIRGATPLWQGTWSADSLPDKVPSNNVTDIAVDPMNGDVWATTRADLESVQPTPQRPNTFFRTRYGGIVVVHPDGSLDKFQRVDVDPSSWPKADSLLSVAVDSTGLKYFGTGDLTLGGVGVHILRGNTPATAQWRGFASGGSSLPAGITAVPSIPNGANRVVNITVAPNDQVWLSLAGVDTGVDRGAGMGVCRLSWDRNFGSIPTCALYDTQGGTTNQRIPGNLVRALAVEPTRQLTLFGTSGRLPEVDRAAFSEGTDGAGIGVLTAAPPSTTTLSTAALGLTPTSNHIRAVAVAPSGEVYVGHAYPTGSSLWGGGGLEKMDLAGRWQRVTYGSAVSQAVGALAFDDKGRLWVGLLRELRPDGTVVEGGIAIDKGGWTIYQKGAGPPSNSVSTLAVDGSKVWVGTGSLWPEPHAEPAHAAGLTSYDTASESWATPVQKPTLLGNEITGLATHSGQTWVANTWPSVPGETGAGGLTVFETGRWINYPANQNGLTLTANDPRALFVVRDGGLWVGGYASDSPLPDPVLADAVVNYLPPAPTRWQATRFVNEGWVSAITARRDGSVWVGLSRGGQNPEDFPAKVFPAGQGNQYAPQGGLRVFAQGEWRAFTPANAPLVSGHINTLVTDTADNLWLGTGLGLMRYAADAPADPRQPRLWLPLLGKGQAR